MKCSKCGKSFKDIKAIGAHYRKSHPAAMKAKKPRTSKRDGGYATKGDLYETIGEHVRLYHRRD